MKFAKIMLNTDVISLSELMKIIMESNIETGYRYWLNSYELSRLYPVDEIDVNDYPYPEYWIGNFFETRKEAEFALKCFLNFCKYKNSWKTK